MIKLIPTLPTGFPFEIEDLLSLQNNLSDMTSKHFAGIGNAYILQGCIISNVNKANSTCYMSGGTVWMDGEVRQVESFTGSYPFYIVSDIDSFSTKIFENGTNLNAYIYTTAKVVTTPPAASINTTDALGDGNQPFLGNKQTWITMNPDTVQRFSLLVTHDVAVALAQEVADRQNALVIANTAITNLSSIASSLQMQVTALKNETKVPIGAIIDWSGLSTAVPTGWQLCDGTGVAPDLRGKFIVGFDPTDPDYDTVGKTGGEKKHTLTISEMPAHNHTYGSGTFDYNQIMRKANFGENTTASDTDGSGNGGNEPEITTSRPMPMTGGGMPHENRPPYYVLCKIMRIS